MVQNFGFGSAEESAFSLALLIALGFLIMSLPYTSTAIDDANINIFSDVGFDVDLPHKNDWGANGTFVNNTENVSGTLQLSDTTESGIYLTDAFSGEENRTLDLERLTYTATAPQNSEVIAQVGISNDRFTSYEERENYTLDPDNSEAALNDFNKTGQYVNAKLWLTPAGGNAPTVDALGFEGSTIESTDEQIPDAIENIVFFLIIVFALAYAAWLIVGM